MSLVTWAVILFITWFLWQAGYPIFAFGVLLIGVAIGMGKTGASAPAKSGGGGGGGGGATTMYPSEMKIQYQGDWKGSAPWFAGAGKAAAAAVTLPISILGFIKKQMGNGGGGDKK